MQNYVGFESLLRERDFNVRVSKLPSDVKYPSVAEKLEAYIELVRDALGGAIITSNVTLIGNYTIIKSNGDYYSTPFQLKGVSLIDNLKPSIKKSIAIRINIRLKEGGYKSWIIAQ